MSPFALLLLLFAAAAASAAEYTYCQAGLPTCATPPAGAAALLQVSVVTRHGDRAPVHVFPNEGTARWDCAPLETTAVVLAAGASSPTLRQLYDEAVPAPGLPRPLWQGNCTPAMLTEIGAAQHARLGARMREIYVLGHGLLPKTLKDAAPLMRVRSTDLPRTKQSAAGHLAGLFPIGYTDGAAPVELHTTLPALEVMNPSAHKSLCPRLAQLVEEAKASAEWKSRIEAMADVRKRLDAACGTAGISSWNNAFEPFNDNLNARWCHGLDLPCSEEDASRIALQTDYEMQTLMSGSAEITRLNIGFFVGGELIPAMRDAVEKKAGTPRYLIFSGHDYTISALLGALGHGNERWPPFASNILFEVWQLKDASAAVRVFYNGVELVLDGCSTSPCPWAEFLALMDSRATVHDVAAECARK